MLSELLKPIELNLVRQVLSSFLSESYEIGLEQLIRSMAFHDVEIVHGTFDKKWVECRSLQTGELHNIYGPAVVLKTEKNGRFYINGKLIEEYGSEINRFRGENGETIGWYIGDDIIGYWIELFTEQSKKLRELGEELREIGMEVGLQDGRN